MSGVVKHFDTGLLAGAKTERGFNQSTSSGRAFWSADPKPLEITIADIAAHLSRLCRFAGALRDDVEIYTVAQHCCLVSDRCPSELRLEGLLHDAAEAYTGDLIKPIKIQLPEWKALETRVDRAIRIRFGLPLEMTPAVKEQDWLIFPTEVRDVCPRMLDVDHGPLPPPWAEGHIEPWGVMRARAEFLSRFRDLY